MSSVSLYPTWVTAADPRHGTTQVGNTPAYIIPEIQARDASLRDEEVDALNTQLDHGQIAAWSKAGEALSTMSEGLDKVKKMLSKIDPSLNSKDWDFSLEKGKLVSQGANLTDKEKEVLDSLLNKTGRLVDAAAALEKSSFDVYDVKGNGSVHRLHTNPYSGRTGVNYYKDVEKQLAGSVNFRHLMNETANYVTNNGKAKIDDPTAWGQGAILVMESYLTPSDPIVATSQPAA